MVLDLLVPPRCPACGAVPTSVWCGVCLAHLARLALPGLGAEDLAPGVRAVGAYAYTDVVRDTILAVKAGGRHDAVDGMGSLLRARLKLPAPRPGLAVTWVPTARRTLAERGVCVPRRLAGPRARPLLRRARDTPDQTALGASARRTSVAGVFAPTGPAPPAVVLVDDVRTTGGTALAAAAALRTAGARRVLVATFAVAGQDARDSTSGHRG
jgi:predicted amidophosphoribosyltransferase